MEQTANNRLDGCFRELKKQGKKALIPYIAAGDPGPALTVPLMHAMVKAGVDIIELGVPFSDPMADGPVIQRAVERALAHNVSLRDVIEMVKQFREQDQTTPVVLMGYLNPFEQMEYAAFADSAKEAGVDGVLTVDMPPEEAATLRKELDRVGLDPIFLIAPTSRSTRIKSITKIATGYLYYVSLKGITGSNKLDIDSVVAKMAEIRAHTEIPICVGFGIKDASSAAAVAAVADGVIVGSALVSMIEAAVDQMTECQSVPELAAIEAPVTGLLSEMRNAMDRETEGR